MGCHPTQDASLASDGPGVVRTLEWAGQTMGTVYRVRAWFPVLEGAEPVRQRALQETVSKRLEQINQYMSTYRPNSELSRFNLATAKQWFPVSAETAAVVASALHYHQESEGVLDVTVGPLMRLWGFTAEESAKPSLRQPEPDQVRQVRRRIGCQYLRVQLDPPALQKTIEGLEVDLSALAKGYAVDQLVELLQQQGGEGGLVEIGGEVRTWGLREDGRRWTVGIENPLISDRVLARVLRVQGAAVATSGDYRNFRSLDGEQVSHLIDPQTGYPLPTRQMSVTVCAESCLKADALATALFLMGIDRGLAWSETHGVAAMFLAVQDGKMVEKHSSCFESYLP